ncbi:MAG: AMP-binding protein [Parvibaculum sp.]|uniref:acyl-CoA synthetase n=1 Tax=Parvibaculum sp. TaxID=2024848 RepID=UPI003C77DB1D
MSSPTQKITHGYSGELPPARFNMARYCLAAYAASTPDKVALIVVSHADAPLNEAERWTYGALDDAVRRIAAGLLGEGFKPGERLMIRMPNTSDYALLFFGAIAAGMVPLPSSSQLTDNEAAFLLSDSGASAVAVSGGMAIDAGNARVINDAMLARLKAHAPLADYADTDANDPAFLVYTSGTSGSPKGVLHAQRSAWGRRPMYQGWYGISAADTVLHAGAFNWTYTLGVGLTDPWANGATTVLYNGEKDVQVWPKLLERTQATLFAAVPTLYRQILKYCDLGGHDLSALRHGLTAGEALSAALLDHWREATGKLLYEALGMSECSTYISTGPGMEIRVGSPGKPQPGRCVVALPLDGGTDPLPAGETGMLAVHRSDPGLMLGYWRRADEEQEVYRGDWFIGGDLASFDADGYLWYHGRADDVMNAMGYRVSPQEVEAALSQHPAIAEVAVTEIHVREDVSVIAAFVILKDGQNADKKSVLDFADSRLAAYKRPREVFFVDTLPRTANGKITRRALAQR